MHPKRERSPTAPPILRPQPTNQPLPTAQVPANQPLPLTPQVGAALLPHSQAAAPLRQPSSCSSTTSRFAAPKTNKEIEEARRQGIPRRTQQDTQYCVRLWEEWRQHRNTVSEESVAPLSELSVSQLNHSLSCFVLEIRKKDGSSYPPNTLHHIVAGLLRHMRENGRSFDIFKDAEFATFRASLDAEMKRLSKEGVGAKKEQAEIITEEEKEMWEKGFLGDEKPQKLLDTVVFYKCLYFALRSGQEHRQLPRKPCQIEVVERPGERPYLLYTEDTSKNRPGGLKGHYTPPRHHANLEVPQRCFVWLLKKYCHFAPQMLQRVPFIW